MLPCALTPDATGREAPGLETLPDLALDISLW